MPKLIDIEVPQGSTFIVLRRDDGSTTISVDPACVAQAIRAHQAPAVQTITARRDADGTYSVN